MLPNFNINPNVKKSNKEEIVYDYSPKRGEYKKYKGDLISITSQWENILNNSEVIEYKYW